MKQPKLYLLVIALALLTACSFIAQADVKKEDQESGQPYYEIEEIEETEKYDGYEMTITYPQTPNNQIDQAIVDYINQQKALFKQKSYKSLQLKGDTGAHGLTIDFKVLHQDGRFFVIRFTETMEIGKSEPFVHHTVLNFEKEQGNLLKAEDLFKQESNYLEQLSNLAKEKVESQVKEEDLAHYEVVLNPVIENFQNIALTSNGFLLFLNGPDLEEKKVMLKGDAVEDLLKAEYKGIWES